MNDNLDETVSGYTLKVCTRDNTKTGGLQEEDMLVMLYFNPMANRVLARIVGECTDKEYPIMLLKKEIPDDSPLAQKDPESLLMNIILRFPCLRSGSDGILRNDVKIDAHAGRGVDGGYLVEMFYSTYGLAHGAQGLADGIEDLIMNGL
jgi:hypothetical protein